MELLETIGKVLFGILAVFAGMWLNIWTREKWRQYKYSYKYKKGRKR